MAYTDTFKAGTATKPLTYPLVIRGGVGSGTLTGNITLEHRDAQVIALNPGGASRDVTLPDGRDGALFIMYNSATAADEDLVVKNPAASTLVTIPKGGFAILGSESSTWRLVGTSAAPAGLLDLDGVADALVFDADGDTTMSAPTDNQIDIEIAGADDFVFVANIFRALSGSVVQTNTIDETTAASGVTIDGVLVKDGGATIAAAGVLVMADNSLLQVAGAGTGTGDVVARYGGTATEGLEIRVYEATVVPAAIETNLLNTPANSVILSVQANCQATLTAGGTTTTWSIGTAATPDKYGTAGNGAGDTLVQNGKLDFTPTRTRLAAAEQMVLTGAATGGASDGNTALSVGSVRVRVVYATCNSLDNA